MKLSILILFICLSAKNVNAQLQDHAWKGVFMVPDPVECVFEFKKDTVYLKFAEKFNVNDLSGNNLLEKSVYKIENDTLTLQKVMGGSPCDTEVIGKYRFAVKDEKLSLFLIADDCMERAFAFPQEPLTKIKE